MSDSTMNISIIPSPSKKKVVITLTSKSAIDEITMVEGLINFVIYFTEQSGIELSKAEMNKLGRIEH